MTAPAAHRCVRCDADLTVLPHFKLCWHGVPGAYLTGEKGDLCDPCHEEWEAERKKPSAFAVALSSAEDLGPDFEIG